MKNGISPTTFVLAIIVLLTCFVLGYLKPNNPNKFDQVRFDSYKDSFDKYHMLFNYYELKENIDSMEFCNQKSTNFYNLMVEESIKQ